MIKSKEVILQEQNDFEKEKMGALNKTHKVCEAGKSYAVAFGVLQTPN